MCAQPVPRRCSVGKLLKSSKYRPILDSLGRSLAQIGQRTSNVGQILASIGPHRPDSGKLLTFGCMCPRVCESARLWRPLWALSRCVASRGTWSDPRDLRALDRPVAPLRTMCSVGASSAEWVRAMLKGRGDLRRPRAHGRRESGTYGRHDSVGGAGSGRLDKRNDEGVPRIAVLLPAAVHSRMGHLARALEDNPAARCYRWKPPLWWRTC